jgi:hypothetical protein
MIKQYFLKDLSSGSKIRLSDGRRCTIISKGRRIKVGLGDFRQGQSLSLSTLTQVELIRSACFKLDYLKVISVK